MTHENLPEDPEDMSPEERRDMHLWQLSLATDELEGGSFVVLARSTHVLDQAVALLDDVERRVENLEAKRRS